MYPPGSDARSTSVPNRTCLGVTILPLAPPSSGLSSSALVPFEACFDESACAFYPISLP